jgi:hypothetical protein
MSKKWIFSLLFMVAACSVNAQFRKIPAEVTDAFKAKYADASSVSWKDRLSSFEADFKVGDREMKSFFSPKGEWLKTETKYSYTSLPSEVKDGFKKSKYAELSVVDVTQIDDKDKGPQYKIVVKKNEYSKKNLVFSKTGQLMSDNATL